MLFEFVKSFATTRVASVRSWPLVLRNLLNVNHYSVSEDLKADLEPMNAEYLLDL